MPYLIVYSLNCTINRHHFNTDENTGTCPREPVDQHLAHFLTLACWKMKEKLTGTISYSKIVCSASGAPVMSLNRTPVFCSSVTAPPLRAGLARLQGPLQGWLEQTRSVGMPAQAPPAGARTPSAPRCTCSRCAGVRCTWPPSPAARTPQHAVIPSASLSLSFVVSLFSDFTLLLSIYLSLCLCVWQFSFTMSGSLSLSLSHSVSVCLSLGPTYLVRAHQQLLRLLAARVRACAGSHHARILERAGHQRGCLLHAHTPSRARDIVIYVYYTAPQQTRDYHP